VYKIYKIYTYITIYQHNRDVSPENPNEIQNFAQQQIETAEALLCPTKLEIHKD
jgi:hypothetical protein